MDLSKLKSSGHIREIPIDKKQIDDLIKLAKRDLKVAEKLISDNLDWSFIVSYNSMLQISRAFMYSYGYTTSEEEHHKTVIEFLRAIIGEKEKDLTNTLDRMRRKRHEVTYDESDIVSDFEAKVALEMAKKCMEILEKRIKEKLSKL